MTERIDPKDAPNVYNYDEYLVSTTGSATFLSPPFATPSTFIPHHQASPSTWFDALPNVSTG